MTSFRNFLAEELDETKLKHLEHAEDHVINAGHEGFSHAYHNLKDVHDRLTGKKNDTRITMKYDGSPSVVFGRHPETGRFFVHQNLLSIRIQRSTTQKKTSSVTMVMLLVLCQN